MIATPHTLPLSSWRQRLGLMPIPLRAGVAENETKGFVLLNGSRGSFYLDLSTETWPTDDFRTNSWSSNVGHSVSVSERDVLVQRWDRHAPERFSTNVVSQDLEKFHRHLERDSPPADLSVVAHGIRTFRSVRQALGPDVGPEDALQVYLVMLAAQVDGQSRHAVDLSRWALPPAARELTSLITDDVWLNISDQLERGRAIDDLRPDIRLMLRHASGALFQEAHHLAVFSAQQVLWTMPPDPVLLQRKPVSTSAHFTPAAITRSVVERAIQALGQLPQSLKILDPACGSGEFLREALRQLRLLGYSGSVDLIGFDISEAACSMARFSLAAESNTEDGALFGIQVAVNIRWSDALDSAADWPTDVDLVLMNPPFVSWLDMTTEMKTSVKRILGDYSKNRPDLASPFLLRAAQSVRKGGVVGSVIPASLLDSESTAPLRGALAKLLAPDLIARLGSHFLFQGARIDAGLYVGVRDGQTRVPLAVWADHRETSTSAALRTLRRLRDLPEENQLVTGNEDGFDIYRNENLGSSDESWAPRPYKAWRTAELASHLPRVSALFSVRQGIRTGKNPAFILDETAYCALPGKEQHAFRRAILNNSIVDGRVASNVWVFYPYGDADVASEEQFENELPYYYSKLKPMKQELASRLRRTEQDWWKLAEPRVRLLEKQTKIISTYFGDRGSFAWDEEGDLAVVQGYAWLLKQKRTSKSASEAQRSRLGRNGWLALLAILNSKRFETLLSAYSNHVGGGQWNLSTRFVAEIPLPDVRSLAPDLLRELGDVGETVHQHGLRATDTAKQEDLVAAAYDVKPGF